MVLAFLFCACPRLRLDVVFHSASVWVSFVLVWNFAGELSAQLRVQRMNVELEETSETV